QQWNKEKIKRFYPRVYRWLMRLNFDADLRMADKTPRNSLIIPALYEVFPDAQFIFILRDGRDAALSLAKNPWYQNSLKDSGLKEPAGYVFGPQARFWVEPERSQEFETTTDIHRCVWIWRQYVEHVLAAKSLIPQGNFYQLKYEDFISHPYDEAIRLLDFMGIANADSRAQFTDFVTQNSRASSIGSWQKQLGSEQIEQVESEAGSLLKELGYAN
ncbi:MAG: sulfotransferase, partial [Waterburya sp.]